jgi:non-lysosomal glucosylceramidase
VPEGQCNTYDILNPTDHKQVSYNSAFHLLALRAAEELARSPLINDLDFANTCATAFERGQQTLDANQWTERADGKGHYSFAIEDNSSLMVDTFYPQVLSYSLGLGALVTESRLLAHQRTEAEWNDSPLGLIALSTGEGTELSDGVWQMGSPNWATLNLHLGTSVQEALSQPKKSLENWRSILRDLWNVPGVADQESGLPSVTSHYGYYMSAWHLLLALAGQQADLPNSNLAFLPKLDVPFSVPLLLPGVVGLVHGAADGHFEVQLSAGELQLQSLSVAGCAHPGVAQLTAGKSVTWSCGSLLV